MTMTTEDRTSRLEGAYDQVSERLNIIHGDLIAIHQRIDAQGREVNERIDAQSHDLIERIESVRRESRQDMRNMMLMIVALWGTLVAGIIAVLVAVLNG